MKGVILLAVIHALIMYQSGKKKVIVGTTLSQIAIHAGNQTKNKPSDVVLSQPGTELVNTGFSYAFMPYSGRSFATGR